MYQGLLEKIIGRAAMDLQFRKKMIENPEAALEEYNLTDEQIVALKAIPTDALERFACKLNETIGKNISKT